MNTTNRNNSSDSPPIEADLLRSALDASDHRQILSKCGFSLNGHRGTDLQGVHGPKALGEGEKGNFSVDLNRGLVKDWGSTGYEGHVFDVVQDVRGLDFNEALKWIVDEIHLDTSRVTVSGDGHKGKPTRPPSAPEPPTNSPTRNDPSQKSSDGPESVVGHDLIGQWHKRLKADTDAAQSAQAYLTSERGVHPKALKMGRVGLAHKNEIPDDWSGFDAGAARRVSWWIVFPIPRRDLDGAPVVAVKAVGFDPSICGWHRDGDGGKIPRNVSSGLWDLVPTADGTPQIEGPLLVCEGEVDALCALSNGFNAVTGTAGASTFKPEWAAYAAHLVPTKRHGAVVVYDGDETGREGAQTAAQRLHKAGADVRIASLPDGQDVNDVLLDGSTADLHAYLAQAESFSSTEEEATGEIPQTEEDSGPSYEPFPLHALPGPVRRYVRAASEALPAPPAMVAVPTLSVLSGAIGDAARLQLKRSWTEPATLWTVLVAPSGSTKSPAFKHAVRPIFRRESEARDEYEQALAQWKEQEDPDEQDKPTRDRYRTGDATPEAVVKILNENPRGILLARDELGAWIGSFDRYVNGAADLQFWVEVWQGIQASRDRAGEGNTTVDTPAVPVTGTIQPGTLTEKLDEIHFDTGFAARLIFCKPPPKPKRWTEADVSRDVRDAYGRLLERLYGKDWQQSVSLEPYTLVSLSPDAKTAWIEYYNEANRSLETRPEGPAKAVAAKGITHTARLALILHLCRKASGETDSNEVDAESMEAALEIGQWLTNETLRVYQELELDDAALSPKRRFLQRLPDRFKTAEAMEIAEEDEIPERTCKKWLRDLVESSELEKIKRGLYRKP